MKAEESDIKKLTKYEKARMLGARALQISQGAPILVELNEKDLESIKFNPVEIAKLEFDAGILPIKVKRPFPKAKEEK